jgi:2-hydroxychromene-2-carboxylate isomerase
MRGCLWIAQDADAKPHFLAFVEAVFSAYFSREEDISNDAVLTDICRACGIDAEAFHAGITQPAIKAALKANTDEAIARGAFGAPTIFVGDDMYFGNDRLALVRSAVLRSQAAAQTPA